MIKWRQHLSFLPLIALASLLGITSYTQEAWSCSWTCFWIPGTSLIRITGKKGTGLKRLKINLSWSLQLQPWNRQELCEIWFRISWFLDLSLWRPIRLALRRRGLGLSMPLVLTEVDPGFCVFLLSSIFKPKSWRRRMWSTWQQHSAWCKQAELPVKWHLLLWCLRWCGLFGFLLLWSSDLSGSKILYFNTDLFLNCCSYSYASLHYPDERPVSSRLCKTLETYFQKHLLAINDGSWWLCKFFPSLFSASRAGRAVPLVPCCMGLPAPGMRE